MNTKQENNVVNLKIVCNIAQLAGTICLLTHLLYLGTTMSHSWNGFYDNGWGNNPQCHLLAGGPHDGQGG